MVAQVKKEIGGMQRRLAKIVINVTIWLQKQGQRRFAYEMDEGLQHLRVIITQILANDKDASIVNRFETEKDGTEKVLRFIPEAVTSMKDEMLHPFIGVPQVNRYRGTLHFKMAI